jgi:hypothetical protein
VPRAKPPAKIAVGEWLTEPFDATAFSAWYRTTMLELTTNRYTSVLSDEQRHHMALALATGVGLANEIDLRKLPLVREQDGDGAPVTEKNGRAVRPKLKAFRVQLFARDILTEWERVELPCEVYTNAEGASPILHFATTLARRLEIIDDSQTMEFALRKAREFAVTEY